MRMGCPHGSTGARIGSSARKRRHMWPGRSRSSSSRRPSSELRGPPGSGGEDCRGQRLDAVKRCESDTQAAFAGQVSAARSQPYYLDVTHPNANKGAVVTWMSSAMRIPAAQIATMGDQPNDVLMFAKCGLSIAVANASPEVQREATHVTTSNEEEGFA